MENNTKDKVYKNPEPNIVLILYLCFALGAGGGGIFTIYAAFFGEENENWKFVLFLTCIGSIFLIIGLVLLFKFFEQIVLKIKWDEKQNYEVRERRLNTEEANEWQYNNNIIQPIYHSEKIDEMLGVNYEAKIRQDKYGNNIFESKTRIGGFYYLGSLIGVIFLSICVIASIYGLITAIVKDDIVNIITLVIVSIICIIADIFLFKELIIEFKEKMKVKKDIREGKIRKQKLKPKQLMSRIVIITFLLLFGFMFFCLIMQNLDHAIPSEIVEKVILILFGIFVVLSIILVIIATIMGIKETYRKD